MSLHPSARKNLALNRRIFIEFYIWVFFENLSRKFKFHYNRTRITGTLHEDRYTFPIISRSIFLEWKVFQRKVVEKLETQTLCSITIFLNPFLLWDNVEKCCRAGQATDDNMAHAHCVLDTQGYKNTHTCNTHCFPLQQWLHECASVLRYTCIACLVCNGSPSNYREYIPYNHTTYNVVSDS
jgi:hypothetical protein